MSFGTTPLSNTVIGTNQFPVSAVAVPGHAGGNLTALEGGPVSTDSNGNETAPVSAYIKDGGDITQGSQADSAWIGSGSGSQIAILKKVVAQLGSGVTVSGAITANAGTNLNTSLLALETGGNLATLAGAVSSSKMATKAASGDFADGSLVTLGAKADAKASATDATALTIMQVLKQISFQAQNPASTPVTGTFWQATQPVSGTVTANAGTNLNTSLLALESGGNLATIAGAIAASIMQANVKQINSVPPLMGNGTTGTGSQRVTIASDNTAFTVNAAQSGTWTLQPGNTANTTPWLVQDVVASANGAIPYHNITAATANFTNVKGAACQCYGVDLSNTSASTIFVKLYDKATTPATTDTPKRTWQVPANGTLIRVFPKGLKFVNGFWWAATGAIADNDNTAIAANCVVDFDLNS